MSTDRDVERIVRSWLDEGVNVLPDRVVDAVLGRIPTTPQRHASWLARRTPTMNNYTRLGLVAAAVLAVVIVGIGLFGRINVGPPVATPSVAPSSTPVANPVAGTWVAPDATCTQQIAAIEAAGYSAEQMTSAGFDPTCADNQYMGAHSGSDSLQYRIVFDALPAAATIRSVHVYDRTTDISGKMIYRPAGDSTFEIGGAKGADFEWCVTVRYVIEGGRLTVNKVNPGCSSAGDPPLLDQFALTAIFETSPFTRQP